ncbi:hypothetical protein LDY98_25320 [Pseudomonas aeruginosa]|nr:hypothetical protein [Pseudomonas aeruginosa]
MALLGIALGHAVQAGIAGRRNVGVTDTGAATAEQQGKTLAKLQQRQDEALYQAQSTAYNYCMQNSDKKKRKSCPYPQRNFDFGDDCQDEYRSCYQSCGGTIRRIVHQD